MSSDDELVANFERASLAQFHHADHVQLTVTYLVRHGRDEALRRLTTGIKRLAAADGRPEKFHVTMTRAWLDLIEAARAIHPEASTAAQLVAACPELLDRSALERFYSREVLESERARAEWVPPDLAPLEPASTHRMDRKVEI
jgi:hypothetical protein